ncbi:PepSY-associated TM helix domain-containing protein [Desulfosporosinus nitroreducens]|uniref:PepSY-associated TM helix domain-containing protein n=1 Tax=Desulfosporosinus nitroreducens TaxID=2018668 RepID=UPI00207C894E|nr:PepSY-associated TM helix domain-containing protein [Desulfosporosinus nitroreducens]MCO1604217.1 PepSY domain-containing protein [Desulfosporosinus nitroreducens]
MFRKMRNLHLWIGLITSIIILMEAVTGLMLAHPSLMGMESRAPIIEGNSRTTSSGNESIPTSDQGPTTANQSTSTTNQSSSSQNSAVSNTPSSSLEGKTQSEAIAPRRGGSRNEADNGLMGLVKGLHEGKLGNLNITWVIDLAAISMIVLTISGMYLSIRILRGQRKSD